MLRLIIVITTVIVIVIAGTIIYLELGTDDDDDNNDDVVPPPPKSISINAIPWARVFIKLPQGNNFMAPRPEHFTIRPEPNDPKSNVTPIRGALVLPEETEIKLVYQKKEKIFPYEEWKDSQSISHDFSSQ